MEDAWYAHLLSTSPILQPGDTFFFLPCAPTLFDALTANEWHRMVHHGISITSFFVSFRGANNMLPVHIPSEYGLYGLFSAIWNKILSANYLLLESRGQPASWSTIPVLWYSKDAEAKYISPLLQGIYQNYFRKQLDINPNCLTSYNHLCLLLTANVSIFEIAIGRKGPEGAKSALTNIYEWTSSAAARRACLHAGQIYRQMTRKRTSDSIMFHSEAAIFDAALVLALYLYLKPQECTESAGGIGDGFELTDDVDWASVADEGFLEPQDIPLSRSSQISAARRFIIYGGPIRFSTIRLWPGYGSARRILLDYLHLLGEVGKWRNQAYCHILRVLSDNLVGDWSGGDR